MTETIVEPSGVGEVIEEVEVIVIADAPKEKKGVLWSSWTPLLFFILFALAYIGVYSAFETRAFAESVDITDERVFSIFSTYGALIGFVVGFLSMILGYVLTIFVRLIRLHRVRVMRPIIIMLSYAPWFIFAYDTLYIQKRYTDIGRGMITFVGPPMWWTLWGAFAVTMLWFVYGLILSIKKRAS